MAALAAMFAACTQEPGTPPGQGLSAFRIPGINLTFGSDPVATALASVSSNLADPASRLAGRPALAAQVVAQYEFATEALREPRFVGLNPLAQIGMVRGRGPLRDAVGLSREASPAVAMNRMTELAGVLGRGDLAAAEGIAGAAPFTRPAGEVIAALSKMPFVPDAARAASFADQQVNRAGPMAVD
ncbi:hypothetical protein [Elioraea rosea]|uniref:hypothetical protein n=1 Tax=Elioraea rosea TaxID=2492390 RepID=UPI0011843035|nr:hypothetical protein [Elioraea rosea]